MSFTIGDFKTNWELHTGENSPTDDIVYDLLFDIDQQIYETIVGRYPEKYMDTKTINVLSGTSSYALTNADISLQHPSTGLFKLDDNGNISEEYIETEFGSKKKGFYIDGANLVLTPKPTATTTLKLRFIPDLVAYTSDSDTLFLPEKSKRLYRRWFSFLFYADKEEYDIATTNKQFANEAANQIYKNFSPTRKPIVLRGGSRLIK